MREILFRGQQIFTQKWVEGFLCRSNGLYCIQTEKGVINVYSDTIGQYTGLTANGKKIFEGDIVRGRHWTSYEDKTAEDYHLWRVDWSEKSGLIVFKDSPTTTATLSIHDFADFEEVEVVGNIYDTPELLNKVS